MNPKISNFPIGSRKFSPFSQQICYNFWIANCAIIIFRSSDHSQFFMKNTAKGLIFSLKKYAIHDGPGIRTTIFFKGCPLRCLWCHNPESYLPQPELMVTTTRCSQCGQCINSCPNTAIHMSNGLLFTDPNTCTHCGQCVQHCPTRARELTGHFVSADEVVEEIEKDLIFYDSSGGGMTASGGEPLSQPEFLLAVLKKCKNRSIHTVVDTCCFAQRAILEKVSPYTDLFLCDLKHLDNETHRQLTGVPNDLILNNIRWLSQHHGSIIIRFPLIPGCNDANANIEATASFTRSLPNLKRVDLLQYNPGGAEKQQRLIHTNNSINCNQTLSSQRLDEISQQFKMNGIPVTIGG